MGEIKVTIYERVKVGNDWTRVRIEVPEGRRRDGRLLLKDVRQGRFQLSWYEKRGKKWQKSPTPTMSKNYLISHAFQQANNKKSWFLNNRHRNIADPTARLLLQKKLGDENPLVPRSQEWLPEDGVRTSPRAHRISKVGNAAREGAAGHSVCGRNHQTPAEEVFRLPSGWKRGGGQTENTPFTAAHKLMKVNSFYRAVFHLERGKGVITKNDYKRELKSNRVRNISQTGN